MTNSDQEIFFDQLTPDNATMLLIDHQVGTKGHGRFVYDKLILPLLLGRIYVDKNRQKREVMQSDLDWTIVRPTELTNEPESGDYRVLSDLKGQKAQTIARADVADFLVKQLDSDRYLHQTPLITH
ncbi:NAD(P)-dependent oxidoreductase [Pleurocapsa sp. PCC 7319]|uniref:NAD(P)-dependent oxidoreductase n=1 Tax=Pleurocapsa sp. PCC 7319 TaxID=118161 RepID=UPI000345F316|nr:NAD(P)H-binding protein [Pleurocapsa sp. PCC 7319]